MNYETIIWTFIGLDGFAVLLFVLALLGDIRRSYRS